CWVSLKPRAVIRSFSTLAGGFDIQRRSHHAPGTRGEPPSARKEYYERIACSGQRDGLAHHRIHSRLSRRSVSNKGCEPRHCVLRRLLGIQGRAPADPSVRDHFLRTSAHFAQWSWRLRLPSDARRSSSGARWVESCCPACLRSREDDRGLQ